MTLQATSEARIAPPRFALVALIVISVWLICIIILGRSGTFHVEANQPPLPTILAMLSPPLLFLIAMRLPAFRAEVLLINPIWLNGMQGLRILGAGFLFVASYGHLPQVFAFFAGWGDVLVAFLAPLVVAKIASNRAFLASRRFLMFHLLGLMDFVGAVVSGLISRGTIPLVDTPQSTEALASFPLLIIPCFAVPLWICLHIAALAQRRAYLDDMK
ncbi:hypothetical protein [Sulfitobacter sp.]|jgi:hypothetical protein|uniref:hypothetical protein n=1 Tax=Sulfitobacter sp. TaxID=1903071 RepID=UPI0030014F64